MTPWSTSCETLYLVDVGSLGVKQCQVLSGGPVVLFSGGLLTTTTLTRGRRSINHLVTHQGSPADASFAHVTCLTPSSPAVHYLPRYSTYFRHCIVVCPIALTQAFRAWLYWLGSRLNLHVDVCTRAGLDRRADGGAGEARGEPRGARWGNSWE